MAQVTVYVPGFSTTYSIEKNDYYENNINHNTVIDTELAEIIYVNLYDSGDRYYANSITSPEYIKKILTSKKSMNDNYIITTNYQPQFQSSITYTVDNLNKWLQQKNIPLKMINNSITNIESINNENNSYLFVNSTSLNPQIILKPTDSNITYLKLKDKNGACGYFYINNEGNFIINGTFLFTYEIGLGIKKTDCYLINNQTTFNYPNFMDFNNTDLQNKDKEWYQNENSNKILLLEEGWLAAKKYAIPNYKINNTNLNAWGYTYNINEYAINTGYQYNRLITYGESFSQRALDFNFNNVPVQMLSNYFNSYLDSTEAYFPQDYIKKTGENTFIYYHANTNTNESFILKDDEKIILYIRKPLNATIDFTYTPEFKLYINTTSSWWNASAENYNLVTKITPYLKWNINFNISSESHNIYTYDITNILKNLMINSQYNLPLKLRDCADYITANIKNINCIIQKRKYLFNLPNTKKNYFTTKTNKSTDNKKQWEITCNDTENFFLTEHFPSYIEADTIPDSINELLPQEEQLRISKSFSTGNIYFEDIERDYTKIKGNCTYWNSYHIRAPGNLILSNWHSLAPEQSFVDGGILGIQQDWLYQGKGLYDSIYTSAAIFSDPKITLEINVSWGIFLQEYRNAADACPYAVIKWKITKE